MKHLFSSFFFFLSLKDDMRIFCLGQCEKKSYIAYWPKSWLLAQQTFWTSTVSILRLEDSRDMLALSHKGSSWHCLLACQCQSPLSFDLSQSPQAYVSAGKQCIPSRRHWLLMPFSPLPKQPGRMCASCLSYPASVMVVLLGREIRISPSFHTW